MASGKVRACTEGPLPSGVRGVFFKGPVSPARLNTHTSFSRCCFCQFDSITVIIMEGTAPDNYSIKGNKKLFIVNPATDK